MRYKSQKTYGNDRGFSCAFRQYKAVHSHCSLIHGYSLGFSFTFEATKLDSNNWVYDFGGCKWIKDYLESMFDHTLVVDKHDTEIAELLKLEAVSYTHLSCRRKLRCRSRWSPYH